MKTTVLILMISLMLCALSAYAQEDRMPAATREHHLMPVPASVRFEPGRLALTASFTVAVKGHTDGRLQAGVDRALRRLERHTGLEFSRTETGSPLTVSPETATLVIECAGPGKAVPSVDEDESYSLEISASQAVMKAPTAVGVLRGLETFLQLVEGDREGYFLPLAQIQDKPRFPWRGLLIDSCRHFQPVAVIKRNLDGMAAVKLNVFHWHLTEDQGFRVESLKYPRLHQMGSDGLYYTQEQVRDVIAYARDRGIRVVPEFDMPGHATSWLVGHPELASAPGPYKIERQYGIFDPALDPTREEVYKLLDGFLSEMAALFPDAYMHIGGDENEGKQWSNNPQIQEFIKQKGLKDNHGLQAYFNQRLLKILTKNGKKMIGWDEIFHPDLPKDIVVQSWRGQASLAEGAKKGYSGILSAGYYLDLIQPTTDHYAVDPIAENSDLTPQQAALILGGEACMWSEYVDADTIDSRIWPRLAAIAERFWSPRTVTDVDDMYRRLEIVSRELEELGLTHEKNVGMMLRRLAAGRDVAPLKTLVDMVEPVKIYNRGQQKPSTQMTPLTQLVDVARPDSPARRTLPRMINGLLDDAPRFSAYREALVEEFTRWRDVRLAMDVMIANSPILREADPLAKDLSRMGNIGLEAISYLSSGTEPPPDWREKELQVLDGAAKPKAALEFVIIPSLRQLIIAASEASQLNTMSPADWKKHVLMLATEKPK